MKAKIHTSQTLCSLVLACCKRWKSPTRFRCFFSRKFFIECATVECKVGKKKQEITELKKKLLDYELQEETDQPSRSEELAASFVEPHITVVDGRYEIPVSLKSKIVGRIAQ